MATLDLEKLNKRHNEMLKFQKKIHPFTPTIRELEKLWGLNTTSAVALALDKMVELNYVVTRQKGKSTEYYAVEKG